MRKSLRDENLILFHRGEQHARPFPEGRRPKPDIYGHIENFPFDHAAKLRLRMSQLKMESAQRSFHGAPMVVLNEDIGDAEL